LRARLQVIVREKTQNLRRLEAQRNELNSKVRLLREELSLLQEPGSYVGEVVKVMGRKKVLVKVHPEGKYVVDIDKTIDITKINANDRVALRNDSYTLHLVLPSKVDPLVSLMKLEKVPDSTYDMIGGCDQQIKVPSALTPNLLYSPAAGCAGPRPRTFECSSTRPAGENKQSDVVSNIYC